MKGDIYRNSGAPDLVVLNFKKSGKPACNVDDLKPLVNAEAFAALSEGDQEPFLKVESIDVPSPGTGGVYDASFFKSWNSVMKSRPIPGSKRGHEFASRPASDFYTVAGKLADNADGTQTEHMLIYVPPQGDSTSNAGFIRDMKAGIVNFSLVTNPDYSLKTEKDAATGQNVQTRHFTATKGYERNDAVGYGEGAMPQTVNAQTQHVISASVDFARSLIDQGKVDHLSRWRPSAADERKLLGSKGDDWENFKKWHFVEDTSATENTMGRYKYLFGLNGKLYRSALRAVASRASAQGLSDLSSTASDLIKAIDAKAKAKKSKNGRFSMELDEALEVVKNALDNSQISFPDVAKQIGFDKMLRNAEDKANADAMVVVNAKLGDKPLEKLDAMIAENKAAKDAAVVAAISEVAGPAKVQNAAKVEVENPAHTYALSKCAGKAGDELKNAVAALKDDQVMKMLNAQRADGNSPLLRSVGKPNPKQDNSGGIAPLAM